jgi:hypothetical protein
MLPVDVFFAWPVVAFIRLAWGESLGWNQGALVVRLKEGSWPMRTWYKNWAGTAFGHSLMLSPSASDVTLKHELVHVEQLEASALAGLLLGILFTALGWWWVGLLVWPLNTVIVYLCAGATAALRGKAFYRGNHFEEAARRGAGQE